MHVLRDGNMAPGQVWYQHDNNADPGYNAYQRRPQGCLVHGFLMDCSVNQDVMHADLYVSVG